MAVDLGTANTVVYSRGKGIVLDEPSVVCINTQNGEIVAVGEEAKVMEGRTPENVAVVRPLQEGVIADFEITERMLRYFIQRVHASGLFARPRLLICVPGAITDVEQRAVRDAGYAAGARKVFLIEEPMAAAIGADLPVHDPIGSMVVDIGGGTTEVAVLSAGGIVASKSVRVGGDALDAEIIAYLRREFSLVVGERTAERIKCEIGSAFPTRERTHAQVRGRDLVDGLPKSVVVHSEDLRRALDAPIERIVATVRHVLDRTPPELGVDLLERGVVLAGGGAELPGLSERLAHATGMTVTVADDPRHCVARGTGKVLERFESLRDVLVAEPRQ
ncbi:MAG: rod shape-determining protein [Actinobacteria bacterium]|nr:MAG: rod shape-determining protein [Actinomycetota bacterium]